MFLKLHYLTHCIIFWINISKRTLTFWFWHSRLRVKMDVMCCRSEFKWGKWEKLKALRKQKRRMNISDKIKSHLFHEQHVYLLCRYKVRKIYGLTMSSVSTLQDTINCEIIDMKRDASTGNNEGARWRQKGRLRETKRKPELWSCLLCCTSQMEKLTSRYFQCNTG